MFDRQRLPYGLPTLKGSHKRGYDIRSILKETCGWAIPVTLVLGLKIEWGEFYDVLFDPFRVVVYAGK